MYNKITPAFNTGSNLKVLVRIYQDLINYKSWSDLKPIILF